MPLYSRFLNADLPEYAKIQKADSNGLNLVAYCCNDPVKGIDKSGTWGLYADSQSAAKRLAVGLGWKKCSKVHHPGEYAHYHDRKHKIHIWYGSPYVKK